MGRIKHPARNRPRRVPKGRYSHGCVFNAARSKWSWGPVTICFLISIRFFRSEGS